MSPRKRLLLISNSVNHGMGFLDHCTNEIQYFLGAIKEVLFIPFALHDYNAYAEIVRSWFNQMDYVLNPIHEVKDAVEAVQRAQAIFVGGGNTFRLLKRLYDLNLLNAIRKKVEEGAPYVGVSAGANIACPTIKTTNDMPIVQPPSFDALNLVPFNINPHYLDPDPGSIHQGEPREQRILEFQEENTQVVVGLREGALLWIEWPRVVLKGSAGARIFTRERVPQEFGPEASLNFLLSPSIDIAPF